MKHTKFGFGGKSLSLRRRVLVYNFGTSFCFFLARFLSADRFVKRGKRLTNYAKYWFVLWLLFANTWRIRTFAYEYYFSKMTWSTGDDYVLLMTNVIWILLVSITLLCFL